MDPTPASGKASPPCRQRLPPGAPAASNTVAQFVLGKSTCTVLALTCHIELFTQVDYRESIGIDRPHGHRAARAVTCAGRAARCPNGAPQRRPALRARSRRRRSRSRPS